ncbi:MAG TPA: FtsW/RodA/SpoVE family cell cycle protein, partial [Longimicrobium sp.]|nr:FtsW/RodA/SpoVE family cell cycle protein [Longimicrobium sp.]
HRLIPFVPVLGIFFALTVFFTAGGKVGRTTPWELFLPVFIVIWAATLAEDAYNLARPGSVLEPRRLLNLFLYGAAPLMPFLIIRELGLSIVLAGSLAAMLLVGTRRGWWAGAMMVVWAVLVYAAFNVDERSQTRLALAYSPYRDPAAMTEQQREAWAAKLHQMKLFDANVLEGDLFGEGPGRGHAETAPNAADDGYITTLAAHWGLVGTVAFVLLYTLFVVQILSVAARESGAFERTLVTGVAMLIGIPFWLATLGGIRMIPLTGVAAAFAAHGGAKLLASALAVGLAAGVSHRRAREERMEGALAGPAAEPHAPGVRIR